MKLMGPTLKTVGDWNAQIDIPLNNALAASIDLTGRSGKAACEHAMILMAKSSRTATKQSPKKRPLQKEGRKTFITLYNSKSQYKKFYRFGKDDEDFKRARFIRNRGIAKRSWMWGVGKLLKANPFKPIPGVATLDEMLSSSGCGLILTNRLKYINSAAPAGLEEMVARKASDQIMAQAAKKMEKMFGVTIPRLAASRAKRRVKTLPEAYKQGAML
jgi:hypothetical protein